MRGRGGGCHPRHPGPLATLNLERTSYDRSDTRNFELRLIGGKRGRSEVLSGSSLGLVKFATELNRRLCVGPLPEPRCGRWSASTILTGYGPVSRKCPAVVAS